MVQKIFKVERSSVSSTGWEIVDTETGAVLDLPSICFEDLKGKYLSSDDMLERIDTVQIALAGVTDSLRIVEPIYFDRNSVLKTFGLKQLGTIDDSIDEYLSGVSEYEKFHIIQMERDVAGNDNTIHAYLTTPKDGKLRCLFDRDSRLNAKRNNIKYWVEDYKIESGTQGGLFVRPLTTPEEI